MEADYGITGNFKVIESWMNGVKSVIHIPLDLPSSKLISSVDNNSIISNNNVPQDNTIHDGTTNNGESEKGSATQAKSPALIDFRQSMQVTPTTVNYYRGTVPSVLAPVARPPGLSSSLRLVSQQPQPISFQQNIAQVQAFLSPMEARDGTKRSRFVLQPTFSLQKTGRLELQTPITIHSLRPQLQCTFQRNPFHAMPRTALQQRVQNVMAGARLIQPQQQQQMTPLFSQQFSININNTNYYDLKHLKTSNVASPPNVTTTIIIDPVDEEQNVQSGATSSQISKKPMPSSLDRGLGDSANDKSSSKKVAIKRKKDPNWDSNSVASSESNAAGTANKDDEVILIDENLSPSTTLTSVTTSLASVKQVNSVIDSTLESSMQLGAVTCSANSLKLIIRVPKPQVSSTVAPVPCESNLPAVTEAEARPDCTQDLPRESAGNSDSVSNGGFSGKSMKKMKKLSEIDGSKKNSTSNEKHNKEKVRSNDLSLGDIVDREVMKHWEGADSTTEEAESPVRSKEFDKGFARLSDSKSWTSDDSKTIGRNGNPDVSKIRLSFKNKKPKDYHRPISDDRRSGKSRVKTNPRTYVVSEVLPAVETTLQRGDGVPCGNANKLLDCKLLFAECEVSLERLRMDGLMGVNVENAKDLLCCSKKPRKVILGKESSDKTLSDKKAEAYYQTQMTTKNSKKKKRI